MTAPSAGAADNWVAFSFRRFRCCGALDHSSVTGIRIVSGRQPWPRDRDPGVARRSVALQPVCGLHRSGAVVGQSRTTSSGRRVQPDLTSTVCRRYVTFVEMGVRTVYNIYLVAGLSPAIDRHDRSAVATDHDRAEVLY